MSYIYNHSTPTGTFPAHHADHGPSKKVPSIESLLPNFDRWSIGFDGMFQSLVAASATKTTYPPYDITKFGEKYVIELAVAGFRQKDVEITVKEHTLTVASKAASAKKTPGQKAEKLHSGIARRDFKLNFALADHIEVKEAKLEDGILTITLEQEIPEELKPKVIPITG